MHEEREKPMKRYLLASTSALAMVLAMASADSDAWAAPVTFSYTVHYEGGSRSA